MKGKVFKGFLTVVIASVFSTIGIFASDTLRGVDSRFNLASVGETGICASGMVPINGDKNVICVDLYEASPGAGCPNKNPANILESEKNSNTSECYAASVKDAKPWTFISLPQAQRMCASAGKRLPTSDEWYKIALGTQVDSCIVRGSEPKTTGSADDCVSPQGVYDMVGNVWEWVDETVTNTDWKGRILPDDGYVASVDASGIAITSDTAPQELYGNDYIWSETEGVFGMLRGGFFGSQDDAGLYTVNASIPPDFASQGVGFRCVEDVLN